MSEDEKLTRREDAGQNDPWGRLTPLAERFLENQNKELEVRLQLQQRELEVDKMESQQDYSLQCKTQENEMTRFRYLYWLFAALLLFFMGISAGLIFFAGEAKTGILILTHLALYGGGLLSGLGLKKLSSRKDDKDED